MQIFARITKVDEQTGKVYGRAVQEVLDRSGEIFDYETSKPNFAKWSEDAAKATDGKSVGNVRAMHGKIAAGKLTEITFNDAEKAIDVCAEVVDPVEREKCIKGVYTGLPRRLNSGALYGFSIGGSGGGGLCVADEMWIRAGSRAGDADIGDAFDCIDLPTQAGKHQRALQGVTRGMEECVRLITSDGCALVCSVSTPFDLPDGRNVTARHMLGEQVITDLGTASVTSLALVGAKSVTRAHLGGVSYAAGADPTRRIYSHNGSISKP